MEIVQFQPAPAIIRTNSKLDLARRQANADGIKWKANLLFPEYGQASVCLNVFRRSESIFIQISPNILEGSVSHLVNMKTRSILLSLVIVPAVFFAMSISAFAVSVEIPVTPNGLNQGEYVFSVSTNASKAGVAFHVVISSKEDIYPDSDVGLCVVTHRNNGSEIAAVKPETKVTLKKAKQSWTADFIASRELLKTAGICLVFTVVVHEVIDGKTITMPAAQFFEIKLQDFVKQ